MIVKITELAVNGSDESAEEFIEVKGYPEDNLSAFTRDFKLALEETETAAAGKDMDTAEIINDAISRYLGEFSNGVSIRLVNAPYAGEIFF